MSKGSGNGLILYVIIPGVAVGALVWFVLRDFGSVVSHGIAEALAFGAGLLAPHLLRWWWNRAQRPLRTFARRYPRVRKFVSSLGLVPLSDWISRKYEPRFGRVPAPASSGELTAVGNQGLDVLTMYVRDEAAKLKKKIEQMRKDHKVIHQALIGDDSSGKRAILWMLNKMLTPDEAAGVLMFDCSAVPRRHRHSDLLWALAGRFGGLSEPNIQSQSGSEVPLEFREEEFSAGIDLSDEKAVILADIHKLFEAEDIGADIQHASDIQHAQAALRILFEQSRVPIVVSASHPPRDEVRDLVASSNVIDVGQSADAKSARMQALAKLHLGVTPENFAGQFDEVRVTCLVLQALPNEVERSRLLQALANTNPAAQFTRLVEEAVKLAASGLAAKLWPTGGGPQLDQLQPLFSRAIASQSVFEWPLTGAQLRTVWASAIAVPPGQSGVSEIQLADAIRSCLVDLGLLIPVNFGGAPHLGWYLQAPALRDYGEQLAQQPGIGINFGELLKLRDQLELNFHPQNATPFSRHLSSQAFRWIGDLTALIRVYQGGDACIIPLSGDIASTLFPSWSSGPQNQYRLIKYEWRRHSGDAYSETAIILCDGEVPWKSVWRVRIHTESRQGAGSEVLSSIEELIGQIYYVEGDAYRCGPGGVIEAIVIVDSEKLSKSNDGRAPSINDAAALLERRLRSSQEARPLVSIMPYMEQDVADELARSLEQSASILLVSDWEGMGAGVPALVIREHSWKELREYLSTRSHDPASSVRFQCYAAPGQVVLVLTNRSIEGSAAIYLHSSARSSGQHRARGSEIARRLMDLASERDINLLTVRPLGQFGCRAEFQAAPEDVSSICDQLRQDLLRHADLQDIRLTLLGTWPTVVEDQLQENTVAEIQPAVYHRVMRRHLFLAEADAAIVAHATQEVGRLRLAQKQYHALEIGAGTGALTEKLIAAGISRLDVVEPQSTLFAYLDSRSRDWKYEGKNHLNDVESFADTATARDYDIVAAQGVYHHFMPGTHQTATDRTNAILEHRLWSLSKCAKLIRPGGVLILSDEFVCEYQSEEARRSVLDRWYECVIARANMDRLPELAQMEQLFWRADREGSGEYKISREVFEEQLQHVPGSPLFVESRTDFGFTPDCPGGFSIYCLRRRAN